ncbi:MAG TPA: hypothetical protein VG711_03530 [Phycisphaerales bacterium]|nr:hypothetical protein [Phycisphaerales bacterium]
MHESRTHRLASLARRLAHRSLSSRRLTIDGNATIGKLCADSRHAQHVMRKLNTQQTVTAEEAGFVRNRREKQHIST